MFISAIFAPRRMWGRKSVRFPFAPTPEIGPASTSLRRRIDVAPSLPKHRVGVAPLLPAQGSIKTMASWLQYAKLSSRPNWYAYPVIHPNWVKVSQHCCTTRLCGDLGMVPNDRQFTDVHAGTLICPRSGILVSQIQFLFCFSGRIRICAFTVFLWFSLDNFDKLCSFLHNF